jgi:hypothetical protein
MMGGTEPAFDGWIAASEWEPGRPRLRPNDLLVEFLRGAVPNWKHKDEARRRMDTSRRW